VVTAVDLTAHAVALTRRRFELFGLSGDIRQMDAEHLEFPDESLDFVWSWGVIHHSANTEAIIAEMHRVLRTGGEARVMVYHRHSINFWIGVVLIHGVLGAGLLRWSLQELCNRCSDGLIAKYYTAAEMRSLFGRHFRSVGTEVFGQKNELWQMPGGRVKDVLVRMTPGRLTTAATRRLGGFLVVGATK
jgi:ubiquinone/menaquinone biosynthesis C-methylase UbiE